MIHDYISRITTSAKLSALQNLGVKNTRYFKIKKNEKLWRKIIKQKMDKNNTILISASYY
jgi:hypothetical protein